MCPSKTAHRRGGLAVRVAGVAPEPGSTVVVLEYRLLHQTCARAPPLYPAAADKRAPTHTRPRITCAAAAYCCAH